MTAELILYPVVPQSAGSRCTYCWQPAPDITVCEDPRDYELRHLCRSCRRALAAGMAPELTVEQAVETWQWLARQHINQRAAEQAGTPLEETGVTDTVIDLALAAHTPVWMPPQVGWARLETLEHELLELQSAEDPSTVLDSEVTGPDFDPETYCNHLRGLVEDAVHKLIGRTV